MNARIRQFECRPPLGFTLIEITVALVIVVVLAAIVVPRFSGTERRQFESLVEQINDLLIVYAERDRLSHSHVGVFHDLSANWLSVVILEDPDSPDTDEFGWRIDPLMQPVQLPDNVQITAYEDGNMIDISYWPITNRPDQSRPRLEIEVYSEERSATVTLSPYAVSPRIAYSDSNLRSSRGESRATIDLDGGGRNREEW